VEHWDGKQWKVVDVPEGRPDRLWGIDASGPGNVWAVGVEARTNPVGSASYTYAMRTGCGGE
jgi:hypothetical protein